VKKLLLRCDDFGCARGANDAILLLAKRGLPLNVSVLVCGPVARPRLEELTRFYPNVCLGIHAAVTSEWDDVKWGPVGLEGRATDMVDAKGHFHPRTNQVSSLPAALIVGEVRAQIIEAMSWGIPFEYLDEHMSFNWIHDLEARHTALASDFNLIYKPRLPVIPMTVQNPDSPISQWRPQLDSATTEPQLLVTHPVLADESTLKLGNRDNPPGTVARYRNREFTALSGPAWIESLREQQVQLITYRDLS
jgi:predicted glycoside hydrolase/deacetylase ChbG (UPF0249 family)